MNIYNENIILRAQQKLLTQREIPQIGVTFLKYVNFCQGRPL